MGETHLKPISHLHIDMSQKEFETFRSTIYISSIQAPEVVEILQNLPKNKRSRWIREACIMRIEAQKPTDEGPESYLYEDVPNPKEDDPVPSPLDNLLKNLKKVDTIKEEYKESSKNG